MGNTNKAPKYASRCTFAGPCKRSKIANARFKVINKDFAKLGNLQELDQTVPVI